MPSFFAASTSAGVIATGSGAWARTGEANTAPAASVAAPCRMSRLESFRPFIASSRFFLFYRLSARQRSGGSVNQTSLPFCTLVSVGVVARKLVPSATSTM